MAKRLRSQEQERDEQTNLMDILGIRAASKVRIELTRAVKEIMAEFRFTGRISTELITKHKSRLFEVLDDIIDRTVNIGAERQFVAFKKSYNYQIMEKKQAEDNFARLAQTYVTKTAANEAELTGNTTNNEIETAINEAQSSDDITSREDVVSFVNVKVGKDRASNRSKAIGLTVVHQALNWSTRTATDEITQELDLLMKKEWVTAGDSAVREAHIVANGQQRAINDPFLVDGEFLMEPGDPNGSPENIINCRCAMGFVEIPTT